MVCGQFEKEALTLPTESPKLAAEFFRINAVAPEWSLSHGNVSFKAAVSLASSIFSLNFTTPGVSPKKTVDQAVYVPVYNGQQANLAYRVEGFA